jgi:sugar O-acyltransferase (sialic acid O-acetyltransferase NeuD family)
MARLGGEKLIIIGAGGFGREVLDIVDACNAEKRTYDVLGFIVQREYGTPGTMVHEKPILGDFDWIENYRGKLHAVCAVGDPHHRARLVRLGSRQGVVWPDIIHPSAILTRWVTLGEGVIIGANSVFTNQITIGNHVHVNLACTVGHNVFLHDFVTLAPGVHISGEVTIEEGCYIGSGVNTIEKLRIGEWSVIGAGSVVIRNVPPNVTVAGVPARIISHDRPDLFKKREQ